MKWILALMGLAVLAVGCASPPSGIGELIEAAADDYLSAWQKGDWPLVYQFEERTPSEPSLLHGALTDSLVYYSINEVRYTDSAAVCAVVLQWQIRRRIIAEAGELYLTRRGIEWRVTGFRSF